MSKFIEKLKVKENNKEKKLIEKFPIIKNKDKDKEEEKRREEKRREDTINSGGGAAQTMDYNKYGFFKVKKVLEKIVNIKNIIIIKNENNKINNNKINNNNNIIRIKMMRYINYIIVMKILIMIDLFIQIFPYYKFNIIDYKSSYIMVKVNGNGNKYVFYHGNCNQAPDYPDEVWINEVKQDKFEKKNMIQIRKKII